MTDEPTSFVSAATMVTFVLRSWLGGSADQVRWWGQIEHVQSGRRMHLLGVEELCQSLPVTALTRVTLASGIRLGSLP